MIAEIFSLEKAEGANIRLVDDNTGQQAIYQTIVALQSARRSGSACTKSRADVAGSGKKLWKQKGTGNARMGSRRSPIWKGGGVVWGPKPRDYTKKVNKKVQQLALRSGLTSRIKDGDVISIENFKISDGKTKTCLSLVKKLTNSGKTTIAGIFDELTVRSAANLCGVKLVDVRNLNVEHVLDCGKLVLTNDAIKILAERTVKR